MRRQSDEHTGHYLKSVRWTGGLGQVAQSGPAIIGRYQRTLSHADWWDSALETASNYITCTAGVPVIIGRYQVKPRQRIHFGYGIAGQDANQGYMYLALYDDTATNSVIEEGKIRLVEKSYDNFITIPVGEWRCAQLRGDVNDKNKKIPLPEQIQFDWVGEDSYLCIEFTADATDGIVKTAIGTAAGADIWDIPVTIEVLRGT